MQLAAAAGTCCQAAVSFSKTRRADKASTMQVGRVYAASGVVQQRLESHLNSLSRVQQSSAVNCQGDFGVDLLCGRLRLYNRDA